jgi:hypothetical protein
MAPSLINSTTKVAAHVCDPYIIPLMYTPSVHEAIHSIDIAVPRWPRPQHQPGTCAHVNRPRVIFGSPLFPDSAADGGSRHSNASAQRSARLLAHMPPQCHHSPTSTIPSGAYHTPCREHPARASAGTRARNPSQAAPAIPRLAAHGLLPAAHGPHAHVRARSWPFLGLSITCGIRLMQVLTYTGLIQCNLLLA